MFFLKNTLQYTEILSCIPVMKTILTDKQTVWNRPLTLKKIYIFSDKTKAL